MNIKSIIAKNRFIVVILLSGLVIRLLYALYSYYNNITELYMDDLVYRINAKQIIVQGLLLPKPEILGVGQGVGIGLPLILSIIYSVSNDNWLTVFVVNSMISSATIYIIYLFSLKIFGKSIALISSVISSYYVLFIQYVPTAGKEIWLIFLFIATIYFVYRPVEYRSQYWRVIPASISYILLIHIDERYFAYFPILIFYFFFLKKQDNLKNKLITSGLFSIAVIILMLPWAYRNYLVYDKIVLLTPRTAQFTDGLLGQHSTKSNFDTVVDKWYLSENQIDSVISGKKFDMPIGPIGQEQIAEMKNGNIPGKFSKLETYLSSFLILWKPIDFVNSYSMYGYRFDPKWSWKHNISVGLTYGLLLPFMFIGFYYLLKQSNKFAVVSLIIIVVHTLVHVLLIPYTRDRYRIPIDPIIIIIASNGIYYIFQKLRVNSKLNLAKQ